MDQDLYQKLVDYSFRLLAKKRYTSSEMEKKFIQFLAKRQQEDSDLVQKVMERLFELKYLDDQHYLDAYISDRLKFKPRGKFMIIKELSKKGLERKMVEEYFRKNEVDEVEVAIELLKNRERRWEGETAFKKQEKAARYLASKGFQSDIVYKTVNRWYNPVS